MLGNDVHVQDTCRAYYLMVFGVGRLGQAVPDTQDLQDNFSICQVWG